MFQTASLTHKLGVIICFLAIVCNKAKEERLPYYNTPDFTPAFSETGKDITHTIGPFSCIDQNSQPITEATVKGHIHVANFFFTSCGSICPLMTSNMSLVSKEFERDTDIILLSYSVTPWIDSVSRLREYANARHINNPRWHLLTGKKQDIYNLARRGYFAEEDIGFTKDSNEFLHTEHFILADRNLRIRGIYNGTLKLDAAQLIKDIRTLENESY